MRIEETAKDLTGPSLKFVPHESEHVVIAVGTELNRLSDSSKAVANDRDEHGHANEHHKDDEHGEHQGTQKGIR